MKGEFSLINAMPLSSPSQRLFLLSINEVRTVLFCSPFLWLICCIIFPLVSQIMIPFKTEFITMNLSLIITPPKELFLLIKVLASVSQGVIFSLSYRKMPLLNVATSSLLLGIGNIPQTSVLLTAVVPFRGISLPFLYSKIPAEISCK
ncbi:hypothetical protein D3C85_1219200 [compost metagenome]